VGRTILFKICVAYLALFAKVAPLVRAANATDEAINESRLGKFELHVTTKKKEIKKTTAPHKAHTPASVASILGRPVVTKSRPEIQPKKVKAEWRSYYNCLLELREQLMRQMNGLAKESAQEIAGYSLHMADSGTDNFDRDFALSLLSSDQDAVYEIEEALKRIERNTYGVCELTNKPIPKARLEAIPWARFTVQAQAQLERDGTLRQRRIGQLGTVDAAGAAEVEEDDEIVEEKPKEKEQ
jgi:DnaK suppressor protein